MTDEQPQKMMFVKGESIAKALEGIKDGEIRKVLFTHELGFLVNIKDKIAFDIVANLSKMKMDGKDITSQQMMDILHNAMIYLEILSMTKYSHELQKEWQEIVEAEKKEGVETNG